MDILRKLGCGLSKLSIRKKGSSKSKSTAKRCEVRSDGLTYNSPFGASFRRDSGSDLSCSFVSPEASVNRSYGASGEDFDGLEGSISSFDKPFLEQANQDNFGHGSQRTKTDFKAVYWKSVDAGNAGDAEKESRKGKSSNAVVKRCKPNDLESLSFRRKYQTVDIKSQEKIENPSEYSDIEFDSSNNGTSEHGAKCLPEDPNNGQTSEIKARRKTCLGSNLLGTSLDSLKSSIEEIIDSGLRFNLSYKVAFEAATEDTFRNRSKLEQRRPDCNTSISSQSAAYGHDLQKIDVWNIAEDLNTYRVWKPLSTPIKSLDNMLSRPYFPDDAKGASVNFLGNVPAGKRRSLRRRSSSLSAVDRYQRSVSGPSSRRGTELPPNVDLDIFQATVNFPSGQQQLGSFQNDVALEKSVGERAALKEKRQSQLRRIAVMMCPRPYGFMNTAHRNCSSPWDIEISARRSSSCSAEASKPVSSCIKCKPKLYTTSGLLIAEEGDSASGNELPHLEYPKKNTVDKHTLDSDTVESPTSLISSCNSNERTEQPFQESTSFAESSHILSPYLSQKTTSSKLCITMKPVASESSPTASHRGGNFDGHSLPKSLHQNVMTHFQQTTIPGDTLRKYSDLEEIKFYEPSKMASVHSIPNDDPSFEMLRQVSSVAMTNPHPLNHDLPELRFGQAFSPHQNSLKLEHPFSCSSCIFYTKEAILRQSRKGWNPRCNQDSD